MVQVGVCGRRGRHASYNRYKLACQRYVTDELPRIILIILILLVHNIVNSENNYSLQNYSRHSRRQNTIIYLYHIRTQDVSIITLCSISYHRSRHPANIYIHFWK